MTPLSHVGQTAQPALSQDVEVHCAQAQGQGLDRQSPQQAQQSGFPPVQEAGTAKVGDGYQSTEDMDASVVVTAAGTTSTADSPTGPGSWDPPATRLPQHPQQQQEDPASSVEGQQRICQQGEQPEDTSSSASRSA